MGIPLTKKSTDRSDRKSFLFSFFCDRCGKEWRSLLFPFTSGGFSAIEHEEAWKLIWEKEHNAAFEQANLRAHLRFNNCPVCSRWVCDDCFYLEGTAGDVCMDCR
jgi:hypothetical protein